ncbi:hypothetical protein, partial [Morganella morganii]|uniref:hypothetical protein n=1 Tax=Morganella morganii TaxID=582 RepID=UPI0019541F6B
GEMSSIALAMGSGNRCLEETVAGKLRLLSFIHIKVALVYGSFLPLHIFYRLHAVSAYLWLE